MQPKDVNAVFLLVNTRIVVSKGSGKHSGASFATIEEHSRRTRVEAARETRKNGQKKTSQNNHALDKASSQAGPSSQEETVTSNKAAKKRKKRKGKKAARIKEQIAETNYFKCGKKGHWERECPYDLEELDGEKVSLMTLVENNEQRFYGYKVALDNARQVNVMHPRFLTNLRKKSISFKGLDKKSNPSEENMVGDLIGLFECVTCKDAKISILSQDDVEKLYEITYLQGDCMVVHMGDRDLRFEKRKKIYVGDFRDWLDKSEIKGASQPLTLTTVKQGSGLSSREERQAKEAREFVRNAAYPSENEAVTMV